jgi:hypothetical protein
MAGRLINDELERIKREAVISSFEVSSQNTLGGTEEVPPARTACVAAESRNGRLPVKNWKLESTFSVKNFINRSVRYLQVYVQFIRVLSDVNVERPSSIFSRDQKAEEKFPLHFQK